VRTFWPSADDQCVTGDGCLHACAPAGLLAALGLAVLALSACSAHPPQSAATPGVVIAGAPSARAATPLGAVDSCLAVTQAEAGSALGQTVRAPVRGRATVEGGIACVFYGPNVPQAADPDVPVNNSVRVVLVRGPDASTFFNDYRSKVKPVPVPGLGDQAYYDGTASLSVLKGNAYLRVAVIGVTDVLGAEEKLAQAALPRM